MFGIKQFTAIINAPQSCILAVGGAEKRVVADAKVRVARTHLRRTASTHTTCAFAQGGFTEKSFMLVTLSADHRVLDGAIGAKWLTAFKKYIENPMLMLI